MRLTLALAFALALAGCDRSEPAPPERTATAPTAPTGGKSEAAGRLDRSRAGSPAPDAVFEDPAGERTTLADFRGKPVLLNLWATWCAPCVAEMPTLDSLAARQDAVEVLAVSQDFAGAAKVDAFFETRKFERLEPFLDPELALMTALKADTLPTTILYDAEGREIWRMIGMEDWTGPRAAALLAEATKG